MTIELFDEKENQINHVTKKLVNDLYPKLEDNNNTQAYATLEKSKVSIKISLIDNINKKELKVFKYETEYTFNFDTKGRQHKQYINEEIKQKAAFDKLEITVKDIAYDIKKFLFSTV